MVDKHVFDHESQANQEEAKMLALFIHWSHKFTLKATYSNEDIWQDCDENDKEVKLVILLDVLSAIRIQVRLTEVQCFLIFTLIDIFVVCDPPDNQKVAKGDNK